MEKNNNIRINLRRLQNFLEVVYTIDIFLKRVQIYNETSVFFKYYLQLSKVNYIDCFFVSSKEFFFKYCDNIFCYFLSIFNIHFFILYFV